MVLQHENSCEVGSMTKYALGVEYDGSAYAGWQRQSHSPSVQEQLESALSKVADQPIVVTAAGRTDAGGHAWQQCVHFETSQQREVKAWVLGVNAHLPQDISVRHATPVSNAFHARYSTLGRSYRYVILNRSARSTFLHKRVAVIHQLLDEKLMHKAAQCLVGEHDFTSFRAAGCQAKHAVREVTSINVSRHNQHIVVEVEGNAFLHNMVRIIVGSLVKVGYEEQPVEWIASLLAARDRTCAGVTAVPCGLYFMGPHYDSEFAIPHWRDSLPAVATVPL